MLICTIKQTDAHEYIRRDIDGGYELRYCFRILRYIFNPEYLKISCFPLSTTEIQIQSPKIALKYITQFSDYI